MGSFTINTPPADDPKILANIGRRLNLRNADGTRRSATGAEAKQFIVDFLKLTIKEVDAEIAREGIVTTDVNIT